MEQVNSARPLPRDFYLNDTREVALQLLGKRLLRTTSFGMVSGIIVETEAYLHDDPASHSFNGPTKRNQVMFGPPGITYVYFSYGIHDMLNVTTQPVGVGEAVLFRAAFPVDGIEIMRQLRGSGDIPMPLLAFGPGRLTKAFGISRFTDNGIDLTTKDSGLWIEDRHDVVNPVIITTTRIGITKAADKPWRYYIKMN